MELKPRVWPMIPTAVPCSVCPWCLTLLIIANSLSGSAQATLTSWANAWSLGYLSTCACMSFPLLLPYKRQQEAQRKFEGVELFALTPVCVYSAKLFFV